MNVPSLTTQIETENTAALADLAGVCAGTCVLTLDGDLPVQFLAPGDRVVTRSGARVLTAITVTLLYDAEIIRIASSALGHNRPEDDLFLAPAQQILLRDWRAMALYQSPTALVEAQRLADGDYIRKETVAEVRIYTLHFAREEIIFAGGVELACAQAKVSA
ncbi:Hint domain-containing protein [Xinfangfangia sp. CPCC 101601]|uniref:Hint domain-containing protein n=1 Tax=Pseudogemmobacter lacusdianii TaxID=3069608 RepID=A0ABU0W131_9RHOB|nr:Hint domain-containing protein [Xinfangfangia sp. CPCC 101601]MDQ2067721.1 Hint domain-containing protein [Xinfangfangia sp. CPCC 101601]